MLTRKLGKSDIEVSALGLGCWAIGGPWTYDNKEENPYPAGWGKVDDKESIRAIHAGIDLGVNFFDTAANYGAGHSERLLAQALEGQRDKMVIATKFGYLVDEKEKIIVKNRDVVIKNIRRDCEHSLRRLNTDYIDLYQLHVGDYQTEKTEAVRNELEELVTQGKIRWYGWSTDNAEGARIFAEGKHCTAIQQNLHWALHPGSYTPTLKVCEEFNLASINRGPLFMGILTGKFFGKDVKMPDDDVRFDWDFKNGPIAEFVTEIEDLRELLTSGGRTMAQGALGWLWARSEVTIPIPGFKNVDQVAENARAMEFGPLTNSQMEEITTIMTGKYE